MKYLKLFVLTTVLLNTLSIKAKEFDTKIAIQEKGAVTYYVPGTIEGTQETDFMIDTGSGYTAINENYLSQLRKQNRAKFITTVSAVLANGKKTPLAVYQLDSINIGGKCELPNIKAVVLPGNTRNILGLSALKKAAPFAMSVNPPELILSHCKKPSVAEKTEYIEDSLAQLM